MTWIQNETRPARRLIPALAGLLALALLLSGCPEPDDPPPDDATAAEPTPDPDPDPDPDIEPDPEPDPDTPDDVGLTQTCTNNQYGFRVDYPEGWVVNPANGLPPCSAFDPDDASMPPAAEIPTEIAIVIHRDDVAFDRTTDFAGDPTVNAVSRRQTTVDGRTAVVAELEHTGDGMYPQGHRHYGYHVDLNGRTLMATTHDVEAATPSYDQRKGILDSMMRSLRFQ